MKIVCSAIKFYEVGNAYPKIFCGKRHSDIFKMMYDAGIIYDKQNYLQGFLTSDDRFVDRIDGYWIAYEVNQIDRKDVEMLYSEDIW